MRINLLYLLVFFSLFAHSQKGVLTGKITEKDSQEPAINVLVESNLGVRALSDFDGNYTLVLPAGLNEVKYSLFGLADIEKTLDIPANDTLFLDIVMGEANENLDVVVVSAGKFEQKVEDITVSMNVIDDELVENKATVTCEQVVEQTPGLTVQDGQVSIRGGSGFAYGAGSRVLIMVDELPMLSGDANDAKWNAIPVENIEQIEIIKGASSVMYGSSALNGVINVRTKYPRSKPLTKFNLYHGIYSDPKRKELVWWSRNPTYYGGNFLHSEKVNPRFDLVTGANFLNSTGYRQGEDELRFRFNVNTRFLSKKHEGLSYGINSNLQYAKTGVFVLWDSDTNAYVPMGGADPNSETTTLTFQDGYRFNIDPYLTYYTQNGDAHRIKNRWFQTINGNNQGRGSTANVYYSEYQYSHAFDSAQAHLSSGAVHTFSTVNSDLYGDHFGRNLAAFVQLDKKWKKFNFSGGMRLEYFKVDTAQTVSSFKVGNNSLPFQPVFRAGMTYKMKEHTIWRASWGQGYRFPSIAEKFAATNIGTVSIYPNPELQPERGWSAEIGLKQGFKIKNFHGFIDVAAFWTEYTNMIEFVFDEFVPKDTNVNINDLPMFLGFQARNTEEARITGLDMTIGGKGKIKDIGITVFAGYTYMNPIALNADSAYYATTSDSTNTLKFRFRHLVKGDIQFDYKGFALGFSCRYNSFMENVDRTFVEVILPPSLLPPGSPEINLGDRFLPGYAKYREENQHGDLVFDSRFSYDFNDNLKLAFIVNNLLNEEYMGRPGNIKAPRTFITQFTVKF